MGFIFLSEFGQFSDAGPQVADMPFKFVAALAIPLAVTFAGALPIPLAISLPLLIFLR